MNLKLSTKAIEGLIKALEDVKKGRYIILTKEGDNLVLSHKENLK